MVAVFALGNSSVSLASDFPSICGGTSEYSSAGWQDKIIRGDRALIKQFPWIATIASAKPERSADAHLCGAVIIGPKWLLTAGHCVWDCKGSEQQIVAYAGGDFYGDVSAGLGTSLNGPIPISHVFVNESFRGESVEGIGTIPRNDIALVELAESLNFSETVKSASLAEQSQLSEAVKNGALAKVAGFGRKSAYGNAMRSMQQMDARIYDNKLCNLPTVMNGALIDKEMICVGDADSNDRACKGDSGGGLVGPTDGNPTVFGIVSWKRDCDIGQGLGAYTNVANYTSWISEVMSDPANQ
jgi:secreted trypsin-like serine protease